MPSVYNRASSPASASNLFGLNATTGVTVAFWYKYLGGQSFVGDIIRQYGAATNRAGYRVSVFGNDLQVDILGAAGTTLSSLNFLLARVRPTRWNHIAVTFDDATNIVAGYVNGVLWNRTTNTRDMTDNTTTCTTQLLPNISGIYTGWCFDVQVLPNVVVGSGDIPLLMNPTYSYPGVMGRYFGLDFITTEASGTIYDESGNGNNLTVAAGVTLEQGDEPPFRPTFA